MYRIYSIHGIGVGQPEMSLEDAIKFIIGRMGDCTISLDDKFGGLALTSKKGTTVIVKAVTKSLESALGMPL